MHNKLGNNNKIGNKINRRKKKNKIVIIGAGPIGCYLGSRLAKSGCNVEIYEAKKKIGEPVQCTGIITKEIEKILDSNILYEKEIIINNIKQVEINHNIKKNNKSAVIPIDDIIIDRTKFDQHLAKLAQINGAKIFLKHRVIRIDKTRNEVYIKFKNENKKVTYDILVGADGPTSIVGSNINSKQENIYGLQMRAKLKKGFEVDKQTYKVFISKKYDGYFGWVVPETEKIIRIGLMGRNVKNTKKLFEELKKEFNITSGEHQSGLIPVYSPRKKIKERNIFLIGDAAAQVKATTGGGLVPGMKAAQILSKQIITLQKIKPYNKKFTAKKLQDRLKKKYEQVKLKRELKLHKIINSALRKMTTSEYEQIIKCLKNKKIKKILFEENRDNSTKLILKLLIAEPRLILFVKNLI